MGQGTIDLKRQLLEAQAAAEYYHSCVQVFFSGNLPEGATMEQLILATHGRKRLEALKKEPALLQGNS